MSLDSQKAFTVSYREGEDVELSYHYDNAEVTLNVCLGSDFTDGELYFGDLKRWEESNDSKQVRYREFAVGCLYTDGRLVGRSVPLVRFALIHFHPGWPDPP